MHCRTSIFNNVVVKSNFYIRYVGSPMATAPQDVFVFMVGGTTYAESRVVAEFNEENPDMRVVLAATCLHNFETFQTEMYGSGGGGGGGGGRR